uniref:Uncharacterized protein n=1 Tax=Eutreptiella gymnastica TaxID=73025 RepID=A0A7S1N1G0_9EUGL|mmetsp:Transcript_105252/g.181497  ORF Transcript_105252/g.181497 Transcript_105252/m.181497 type:complete len:332 (+) Transcript_105252:26-1021(+)
MWVITILSFLLHLGAGLLDAECAPGQEQCHIHRPHYIYDVKTVISAQSSLYLNNILHCTQHLCEVNLIAPTVTLDVNSHVTAAIVNVIADEVYIDGIINTDGRGHASDQGEGPGSIPISLYDGAIGGGYNGPGRTRCHGSSLGSSVQFGEGEFGDEVEGISNFQHHVGSGGGQGRTDEVQGGRGGGAIAINASTLIVLNGRLSANGQPGMPGVDGSCDGGGGGSGGSITVSAPVITGSGYAAATGAKGGMTFDGRPTGSANCWGNKEYGSPGGSAEGGRIVMITPSVHHAIDMTVKGGVQNEWTCVDGGDGHIFYSNTQYYDRRPTGQPAT